MSAFSVGQGEKPEQPQARPALPALLVTIHVLLSLYGSWQGFTGNFDTGTVELMAVNIARGEDFPLFWYGLHYAGALEAYVAALMIKIFGFSELALTLSPILFSALWILATWLFFTEIGGRRAGLAATLASIFSGYFIRYYGYALSGGYSVILGLGTLILWLSARILRRDPAPGSLAIQVLAIGLLSGLAVWVHFFIFPYLAVAAFYLLAHWIRRGFSPRILAWYLAGAALAALGLLPFHLVARTTEATGSIAGFVFSLRHIRHSLIVLLERDLRATALWKAVPDLPFSAWWFHGAYLLVFACAGLSALCFLLRRHSRRQRVLLAGPIIFLLVFLIVFLPHRMAIIPSPRYVLGFWAMLVAVAWGYGAACVRGRLSVPAWGLLGLFVLYNGFGEYFFLEKMAVAKEVKLERTRATLAMVREDGLSAVYLLGNEHYGYSGQKLSAFTGNTIRFVATGKERYQKNAQQVEDDPAYGLMCRQGDRQRIREALNPLQVGFRERSRGRNTLFDRFVFTGRQRRVVALSATRISLVGADTDSGVRLLDRNGSTAVFWPPGSGERGLEVEFSRAVELGAFWFMGVAGENEGEVRGLPRAYTVSAALPGQEFEPVITVRARVNQSYIQGGHVYVSGYFGKSECRFPPRPVQRLKIRFPDGEPVRISELVLFAVEGRQEAAPSEEEIRAIRRALAREGVVFTLADRWLSARLIRGADPDAPLPALPRFNPRADNQEVSRLLVPRAGLALAPAREVAGECERLLLARYGPGVIRGKQVFDHYVLFFLAQVSGQREGDYLYWNGHLLERIGDYRRLAAIRLGGTGIRMIDPVRERSKGIYFDGWTRGVGTIRGLDLSLARSNRVLVMITGGHAPHRGNPDRLHLEVRANGRPLELVRWRPGLYFFRLPPDLERLRNLEVASIGFRPGNGDDRLLGMDLKRFLLL